MRLAILTAVALLGAAAPALAASPVEGTWRTQGGSGTVEIAPCGAQICGRLVDFPELKANPGVTDGRNRDAAKRGRPLKGVTMLAGFTGGPKKWTGGTIYNPGDGRTYRSVMELASADVLKVKGCVGPICQTQTWTRAR
jgi:uncharacterized protein (DUF2147 family)